MTPAPKPLPEALADFAKSTGLDLAAVTIETTGGTTIRVVLADTAGAPPGSPWTFTRNSARYRGTELVVSGKKLAMLRALAAGAGEPVPTSELVRAAWGDNPHEHPDPVNFNVTMYQLRQLLFRELRPDRDPIECVVGAYVLTLA
jgi:hypothetical protein